MCRHFVKWPLVHDISCLPSAVQDRKFNAARLGWRGGGKSTCSNGRVFHRWIGEEAAGTLTSWRAGWTPDQKFTIKRLAGSTMVDIQTFCTSKSTLLSTQSPQDEDSESYPLFCHHCCYGQTPVRGWLLRLCQPLQDCQEDQICRGIWGGVSQWA